MKLSVVEVETIKKEIDIEFELDLDAIEKINEAYHQEFLVNIEKGERWRFPDDLTEDYLKAHFRYLKDERDYDYFPQFAFYEVLVCDPDGSYITTLEEFLRWTIRDIAESRGWSEDDERVIYTAGDPDPAVFLWTDDDEN